MPASTPCKSHTFTFPGYKTMTLGPSLDPHEDLKTGLDCDCWACSCCLWALLGIKQLQVSWLPATCINSSFENCLKPVPGLKLQNGIRWTGHSILGCRSCPMEQECLGCWTVMWKRWRPMCNVIAFVLSCCLGLEHSGDKGQIFKVCNTEKN